MFPFETLLQISGPPPSFFYSCPISIWHIWERGGGGEGCRGGGGGGLSGQEKKGKGAPYICIYPTFPPQQGHSTIFLFCYTILNGDLIHSEIALRKKMKFLFAEKLAKHFVWEVDVYLGMHFRRDGKRKRREERKKGFPQPTKRTM